MTAEEGKEFFKPIPKIASRMETLCDVGLGYIKVGQASTTLSGGEAQRVKLATELSKRSTGSTIYILDEPTTASTPTTWGSCWRCSSGWWTPGIRWWSSSTIWT